MKKFTKLLLALTLCVLGVGSANAEDGTKTPILLLKNGEINTADFDITPIAPSTLTTENLYAATFTSKGDLKNAFQYQNMEVGENDKIVVKFGSPCPSGWNIHAYGAQGNFESLEGKTEYVINLDGAVTDFTIFTWFGCRSSITITECYLYKSPAPDTREVFALGTPISFADALTSTYPFVVVQNGKVLCGPLSSTDGSLTFKDVSEIDNYSWTIKFEEDTDHPGSYFMQLFNSSNVSKGYINASVWSHTYLSGINKSTTKGEKQDGALWTVTETGLNSGKYSIRDLGVAEGAADLEQAQEDLAAVLEVLQRDFVLLGAHDLDVEADPLAVVAVAVLIEDADLIERAARIDGAEGEILVELEAVLVVEVDAPQFLVRQREAHFVGGREVGQQGVGCFDEASATGRVSGEQAHGDGVADGRDVGVVNGLVGL